MKEGYKTTEFWLTVFAQVLGVAVLFGVVTAEQVDTLNGSIESVIKAIAGLWIAVAPLLEYIKGRAELKSFSTKG